MSVTFSFTSPVSRNSAVAAAALIRSPPIYHTARISNARTPVATGEAKSAAAPKKDIANWIQKTDAPSRRRMASN
jgi:hypothetical protein